MIEMRIHGIGVDNKLYDYYVAIDSECKLQEVTNSYATIADVLAYCEHMESESERVKRIEITREKLKNVRILEIEKLISCLVAGEVV
jgi:hypothetical protein